MVVMKKIAMKSLMVKMVMQISLTFIIIVLMKRMMRKIRKLMVAPTDLVQSYLTM